MIRTYKRKLILNKAQEDRINSWISVCRFVYNMGLEIRIAAWRNKQERIHKFDLIKQITVIRNEYDWMWDVPADTLNSTMERLQRGFDVFFRGYKNGDGFPKFAKKKNYKSLLFKQKNGWIKIKDTKINLPKLGYIKMFNDSEVIGDIKNVTITKEPKGFFACIQCDNVPKKFDNENQVVGLDMGLSHFCIDSNGDFIGNPKHFEKYERELRIQNRSLARKNKGSNSWKKQCRRLAILHHKISNVRIDFLHKESTKIAKSNCTVYLEDLKVKNMSRNSKLGKRILDAGWATFRTMLEYKTNVVAIDPKYTSQTCNDCGAKDSKSRLSQSKFVCTSCGVESNADINAAKNILCKGIALNRQRESIDCA